MTDDIIAMIHNRNFSGIKAFFADMNVVDIATILEDLPDQESVKAFRMLNKNIAAEVFAYLSKSMQKFIVESISDREISQIIDDMFLDDAVDFIEEMPANVVKRVLQNVPENKRVMINQFLQYPDDSAGSIMTIEYVELKENYTVADAFEKIRRTGVDRETIYTCYVIGSDRKLIGLISVRTLLLAQPDQLVVDIMDTNIIYAETHDDQEEMANLFRKYDLMALPVVDSEKRLVGIVTVDDAVQVIDEENTEDFEKMAALSPSDEPYLKTSVLKLAQNRTLWLLILMLSAIVTGVIINRFEESIAVMPALVAFIPMLMDSGGNAGSQSSTLIIRGMALEEIVPKDILKVLWKELRVSITVGFVLACVNFVRVLLTYKDAALSLTVSLSLYITVVTAKCIGCLLPMGAKKLNLDPAIMAAPIITTIVDASSLFVYLMLAQWILKI